MGHWKGIGDAWHIACDEGILRFREIAILQWVRHIKHNIPHWEGPENMFFTTLMWQK